jgi:hypothetical protein
LLGLPGKKLEETTYHDVKVKANRIGAATVNSTLFTDRLLSLGRCGSCKRADLRY